jgi:hypothetical protein
MFFSFYEYHPQGPQDSKYFSPYPIPSKLSTFEAEMCFKIPQMRRNIFSMIVLLRHSFTSARVIEQIQTLHFVWGSFEQKGIQAQEQFYFQRQGGGRIGGQGLGLFHQMPGAAGDNQHFASNFQQRLRC